MAAHCSVLLTLDKGDFGLLLGTTVYGMWVRTPRDFLVAGRIGAPGSADVLVGE
ncbi:MAG: hypothetical protein WED15_05790 [Akkermansiaceae bacterium]